MLIYYYVFFGSLFVGIKGNDELNAVVVLFRHGDRTAINLCPNDPYRNRSYWPVGFGQLTNLGKEQHLQLGKWLRSRYDGFLPITYSEDEVYVMSSNVDRCLMSADTDLAGLYPPTRNEIWDEKYKWQPIPVHTRPEELDPFLAAGAPCPKYDLLYNQLYKTELFRNISHENHDLFAYLSKNSGCTVSDLRSVRYLYSNYFVENNFNFTLPNWAAKVYPDKLFPLASFSFSVETFTPEMARLRAGTLFDYIVNFFNNRTSKSPSTLKFLILSAHDTTVADVLNSMGAFEYHCPPYTSTIIFELKRRSNGTDYINIFYKNTSIPRKINLKNCDFDCNYDDFVNILEPITVSLDRWEVECRATWTYEWPLTFQWNIILMCSLITAILLLSAVIVGVKKSIKESDNTYIQLPRDDYS